jgi:hypothetical protein
MIDLTHQSCAALPSARKSMPQLPKPFPVEESKCSPAAAQWVPNWVQIQGICAEIFPND